MRDDKAPGSRNTGISALGRPAAWDGGCTPNGRHSPLEALLGNLYQPSKGAGVADRHVGQHFAIDLNPGLAQPVYEAVVGKAAQQGGDVDSRDPEPEHLELAPPPVAERAD